MESNIQYNQEKKKLSFDFDGCLGHKKWVQQMALLMSRDPHNILHIVTRRFDYVHPEHGDEMTQVMQYAQALNIPRERVHFLNRAYKINKIKELDIDVHFDDDLTEIALIRRDFPKCIGFATP